MTHAHMSTNVEFLRNLAAGMTYNGEQSEAIVKHRLHEIAMRIEIEDRVLTESNKDRAAAERYAARLQKRLHEAETRSNTWRDRYKSVANISTAEHAMKMAAKLSRATFVHMKLRDALLKITHAGLSEDVRAIAKEALTAFPLREAPTHTGPNRHPSTGIEAQPVGKEFDEQYMQSFPERRTGDADRRKVRDEFTFRRRKKNTGRRKTDKTVYFHLPDKK